MAQIKIYCWSRLAAKCRNVSFRLRSNIKGNFHHHPLPYRKALAVTPFHIFRYLVDDISSVAVFSSLIWSSCQVFFLVIFLCIVFHKFFLFLQCTPAPSLKEHDLESVTVFFSGLQWVCWLVGWLLIQKYVGFCPSSQC
jgi:hypothetical protein